jgi:hypothetical protein
MIAATLVVGKKAPDPRAMPKFSGEFYQKSILDAELTRIQPYLTLSASEVEQLTKTFLEYAEIRAEFEAKLARVTSFDGNTLKVAVPHYLDDGHIFREQFYNQLKAEFPAGRFEQIDDYLGEFFDQSFQGFGIMDQEVTISPMRNDPDQFHVLWNAKTFGELTPSRVKTNTGLMLGKSSDSIISREAFASGQFRAVGAILTAKFPRK